MLQYRHHSADGMQGLCLPPSFQFSDSLGPVEPTKWTRMMPAASTDEGLKYPACYIPPNTDLTAPRNTIFVLQPKHPFWAVSSAEELYGYLEAAFPYIEDWRSLVPPDVADTFVHTPAAPFRNPQATNRIVELLPDSAPAASSMPGLHGCAVMLVGDAAHSFPPGVSHDHVFMRPFLKGCSCDPGCHPSPPLSSVVRLIKVHLHALAQVTCSQPWPCPWTPMGKRFPND